MKNALAKRIKITKRGKILRRAMGQGHCRAKKRTVQQKRRKKFRGLEFGKKMIKKQL